MTAAGAHGESCVCVFVCRYLPGRYVRYALGMGAWMALSGPINAFSCRCSSSELRAAAAARTMYSSVTFIYKSNDKPTKSQLKFKDECEPRNYLTRYQVSPTLAVSACPFFFLFLFLLFFSSLFLLCFHS